jgi:transposase
MKTLKYAIGIDIAKNDFKACLSVIFENQQVKIKATRTFDNTQKGFQALLDWTIKNQKESNVPLYFLMEATGIYHENLAWYLHNKSCNVIVVLANTAKRYLQSLGIKSKNDKIDAQGLSQMCAEKSYSCWNPLSKNIYILRSLTRLHEDLQTQKNSFNNRLQAAEYAMHDLHDVVKSNKKLIKELSKQIEIVENKIIKIIKEDSELQKKYDYITSIKGVGLMAFAVVVAETNGFALIKNIKQLTSYVGYDIAENQSGKKVGKTRISKKGNSHIRRVLHLPAFSVVKYEKTFAAFYERVYSRTGLKMKGYVAVQRKLLCMIYTLWKKNEVYDPNLLDEFSEAGTVDPLSVGSRGTIKKKPSTKALASLDEHSSAFTASPLSV